MKNLLYFFLSLFLITNLLSACGGASSEDSPVGLWQIESVSGEELELTDSEKSATLQFNEDGSLIRKRGESERKGKWEILEKEGKKLLILKNEEGKVEEEDEIIKLDATTFVLMSRDKEITLKKK